MAVTTLINFLGTSQDKTSTTMKTLGVGLPWITKCPGR